MDVIIVSGTKLDAALAAILEGLERQIKVTRELTQAATTLGEAAATLLEMLTEAEEA